MPVTTEIDTNDEFDWAERTTNSYTLFGTDYEDVTTTFDDGHVEVTNARNGDVVRFTLSDPTDALPIESQVITYALNGDVTSSNTLDDNGQRSVGTYESGVLVAETLTDETDVQPWSTIDITYDDGEVDSIDIDYEQTGDFSQDANFLTEISYDAQNNEDWMFIIEARSGTRSTTTTIADHGGQTIASYTNGVITLQTQYDYGDVADWGEILTQFENGVIDARFTFNDNGTNFIESFEAGVLTMTRLQDDGQNQPYQYIETFYDAEGNATRIETQNDTGELIVEILRETTVQVDTDNTANWSQITTVTDGDGLLIERETEYDNGNVRLDGFEAGQLTERLITEADGDTRVISFENGQRISVAREDVSDSSSWDTILINYDENGDTASRTTTYDNGSVTDVSYDAGVIQSILRTDADDAFGWSSIATAYENGVIDARRTDYDSGDVLVFAYEEGERTARLRFDGDDSHNWVLQLTEFGADGNVTTTYDAIEDLPEDYAYLLDSETFSDFG